MGAMSEKLVRNQVCFGGTFISAITKGVIELLPGYEMSSSSSSWSSWSSDSSDSSKSSSSSAGVSSSSSSLIEPDVGFSTLFPSMVARLCPQWSLRDHYCSGWQSGTTYITTIYNPLPTYADLVVSPGGASFDDDIEVDGISLRGGCGTISVLSLPAGYVMKSNVPPGGSVVLTVVDLWGGASGGAGGADWVAH